MCLVISVFLSGCETPTTQRYSILADNNVAIKALSVSGIGIGYFTGPPSFDANCRALGPLAVADNLTHTQYIQKAFEDELKVAGAFAQMSPRVTLTGYVSRLEFSSSRGLTGGSWTIDLVLTSSNGSRMNVTEYYEFASGFVANEACRQTANAFSRAVQNLVGKAVRSPDFAGLVAATVAPARRQETLPPPVAASRYPRLLTGQELLTHLQSLKEVQVKAPPELMSMTFQVGNRFEILYWTARDASGVRQGGTYSIAPDQNLVCFRIPAELRAGGFGVGSEWMSDCFRVSQTDEKTYSLKNLKGDYSFSYAAW
jgi:hypothetical protein